VHRELSLLLFFVPLLIAFVPTANAAEEYTVIDDFESYDGDVNQVGDTWIDGFTYPYNGSIIHLQAYDNTVKWDYLHYWSEVERTFSDPCDWAFLKVLTLWFYGGSDNDANDTEQMYLGLQDNDGLYAEIRYGDYLEGEDMNDIKEEEWHQWDIGLSHLSDPCYSSVVNDVNLQAIATIYIGFGDGNNTTTPGGDGWVYFDDIRLYPLICKPDYSLAVDLSDDCKVDFSDFVIFALQWYLSPGSPSADFAPDPLDGFVDERDLRVLVNYWLQMKMWPE
jgi:hypothetical protein